MEPIKTAGLILKVCNLNDNDRLFTILTRDLGRVTAIAKGVRSHKHKDFAGLQLFCYSNFLLSSKTGLYYVSGAEVLESFYNLRTSVEKVSLATYLMDIVNSISGDLVGEDAYFSFILNTLYVLGKAEQRCRDGDVLSELLKTKAVFELKTAASIGYLPELRHCVRCGRQDAEVFSCTDGGVLCKSCAAGNAQVLPVTSGVRKAVYFISNCKEKQAFGFQVTDEVLQPLAVLAEQYLCCQLDMWFPSLDYLKKILYQ